MTGQPEETPFEIQMPFLTVASRGGPHDDQSYCAGWEAGRIDGQLAVAAALNGRPEITQHMVHAENLPQLDLIAMRYGFRLEKLSDGDVDWCAVKFTRSEA